MTKKHFEAIAKILSSHKDDNRLGEERMRRMIARDLAASFVATNPLFDQARFLKACNVEA